MDGVTSPSNWQDRLQLLAIGLIACSWPPVMLRSVNLSDLSFLQRGLGYFLVQAPSTMHCEFQLMGPHRPEIKLVFKTVGLWVALIYVDIKTIFSKAEHGSTGNFHRYSASNNMLSLLYWNDVSLLNVLYDDGNFHLYSLGDIEITSVISKRLPIGLNLNFVVFLAVGNRNNCSLESHQYTCCTRVAISTVG